MSSIKNEEEIINSKELLNNDKSDTKKRYHHGDLKECLIKAGVKLLVTEGIEKFSLRRVAAMCNVSHAAPYKHFKNKDELISAISDYVHKKFEESLSVVEVNDPYEKLIEVGKRYVSFMVENYDFLQYIFFSGRNKSISIKDLNCKSDKPESFNVFLTCANEYLATQNIKKEDYAQNIIAMWAMVHGLATMLANKNIEYDEDYLQLVESILRKNLVF